MTIERDPRYNFYHCQILNRTRSVDASHGILVVVVGMRGRTVATFLILTLDTFLTEDVLAGVLPDIASVIITRERGPPARR